MSTIELTCAQKPLVLHCCVGAARWRQRRCRWRWLCVSHTAGRSTRDGPGGAHVHLPLGRMRASDVTAAPSAGWCVPPPLMWRSSQAQLPGWPNARSNPHNCLGACVLRVLWVPACCVSCVVCHTSAQLCSAAVAGRTCCSSRKASAWRRTVSCCARVPTTSQPCSAVVGVRQRPPRRRSSKSR